MDRPVLVAYLSGHGFGHFVRSSAVLSRLDGVDTHVRTNGRALSMARRAAWATSVTEVDVGPGMVQRGPLQSDLPATRVALERHLADWPRRVGEEAAFLRASGARLVFGDVPPLAFAAAAAAGVPSVAMANFSWSWIYDGCGFADAAALMREAESQATLLLELAAGGGLDAFPRRQPIAPVARSLHRTREQIRAAIPAFAGQQTFVLLSLGGFGDDLEVAVSGSDQHRLLVTSAQVGKTTRNVSLVTVGDDLGHHELVASVDALIGKPGYGTVAECLRQPTPFCWLERGDFREAAPLAEAIERWLPSAPITLDDLKTGRWSEVVDRAIASKPPGPTPTPNGAGEAEAILRSMLI